MLLNAIFVIAIQGQGMIGVTSTVQASPRLTQTARVQTERGSYGQPKLIKDARGTPSLIQLSELPDDKLNLELAVYAQDGTKAQSTKVAKPGGSGEFMSIDSAHYNSRGELIVITALYRNGNGVGKLWADNVAKGTGVQLANAGDGASVLDHISYKGHELVVTSENLGHGEGDTYPVLIRLTDEDSGKVLKQKLLDYPVSGKLGTDRAGNLKLLLLGYELFGVMDLKTGAVQELLPIRQQPSDYPSELGLSIGRFIKVQDDQSLKLLNIQALFEGKLDIVREYPRGTAFIGGEKPAYAVTRNNEVPGNEIVFVESIQTGRPIVGFHAKDYPLAQVTDVVLTGARGVIVLSQPLDPDSFQPGTILTYIETGSGTVLRKRSLARDLLSTELFDLSGGRLVAVERSNHRVLGSDLQVVEIFDNIVLSQAQDLHLIGNAFRTASGELVGITGTEDSPICVTSLLKLSEQACVSDPLVKGAVQYGYQPFEVGPGRIQLPLLGARQGFNYPSFGYVDFKVE